ncbi:MAG TPA: DEAD/DEAH box helicase family protein [Candidatus Pacearchaeota archaeon]|nr:DEAD/DEAH box helicase family protein [Candidatus Pacearchaeota archaeon]HPR79856.1 DEAD/DEAH box helicase family protein [Candidatus Pacearchaeota archaeon]
MPSPISIGTRDIPLKIAKELTDKVNASWDNGELLSKVSLVTQDLLKFWFKEPHIETRYINFNQGQRQAILNAIYLHEILNVKAVKDIYENINPDLLSEIDIVELKKDKYEIPKYAIKMATGTGKTWVMHALLIWQYLNAKYELEKTDKFTKNFLLVAPGIIVYDRLLDAYLGKEDINQERHFEESDFYKFKELFVPSQYRDDVFGFVQNSVAKKHEIGNKITGDGMIAIANWHLFLDKEERDSNDFPLDDPSSIIKVLRPISPGVSGGNTLDSLDANYLGGKEVDFLSNLKDLMVINDEAHHIHENKIYGEVKEVEWQKSLNKISKNKGNQFIQIDFSATPYDVTGSGQKRVKHYFPHIIVDFDLKDAIRKGLVKIIAIDKRKEITDIVLDYNAIREGNNVIGLSEGQKLMIRAGINKLKILEKNFIDFTKDKDGISDKHPKMLIMCEDTKVTPFVVEFLNEEGWSNEDVIRVDSDKKGDISETEWLGLKQKLFNIDKHEKPKIIVSVLMLREGFDVSNICVIVPLRSASAPILLEQTIGRGLRLMWREPEFLEIRQSNLKRLLVDKKEPENYIDLLTIIEHPSFIQFYEEFLKEGLIGEIEKDPKDREGVLGDIIKVGLKKDYKKYNLYWPSIIKDSEEELINGDINIEKLEPFSAYHLENLQQFFKKEGESFVSEELTVKTRFGEYVVDANLFKSQSYNEYLEKILNVIINRMVKVGNRKTKSFPVMQINNLEVVRAVDKYIRNRLFDKPFDPFIDNNWKVLLLKNGIVTQHIIKEIGKLIMDMQNNTSISEAIIEKRYFSEITDLRVRENYSLEIVKTIYERLPYPSNKGRLEKALMEYADSDSKVEAIMKINEYYHNFANIIYIRTDGFLSFYYPDFIIKTSDNIYLLETKSDKDLNDPNVKQKQLATLDWIKRINELKLEDRMDRKWEYVLLGETHFYGLRDNNASIDEIFQLAKINESKVFGKLI